MLTFRLNPTCLDHDNQGVDLQSSGSTQSLLDLMLNTTKLRLNTPTAYGTALARGPYLAAKVGRSSFCALNTGCQA